MTIVLLQSSKEVSLWWLNYFSIESQKKIYYSNFIKVLNKIENLFVFFVSPNSPIPFTLPLLVVRSLMWFSAFLTRIIVFSTCCGGSRASGSFEGLTVGTGGSEICISPSWDWDCCSGGVAISPRGSLDSWAFYFYLTLSSICTKNLRDFFSSSPCSMKK